MSRLTVYELSAIEKQKFDGNMLGDGSIVYKTRTASAPRYIHFSKYTEYLKWLSLNLSYLNNRPTWDKTYLDKRTNKWYECYWMGTKSSDFFHQQRQRWYIGSKKILPNDIIVDENLLLHWFLDDGSKATHGGRYFAADDLSFEQAEELNAKIQTFTNFTTSVHNNEGNPRIYVTKKYVNDFLNIIGSCPVECFNYKWMS